MYTKLKEKAFDIVIDMIIEKTSEEIEDILQSSCNQKLLKKTFDTFADSRYFSTEYRDIAYVPMQESFEKIENMKINPALDIKMLSDNILPIVKQNFAAPTDFDWSLLSKLLAGYYKKRAEISVKLYDVSNQLSIQHAEVMENVTEVKEMLQQNINEEHRVEMKREYVFKKFVQSKVNSFIAEMANCTYHFIFKEGIQSKGKENPTRCIFRDLKSRERELSNHIDASFWQKPIYFITVNPKGGIEPLECSILPTQFLEKFFIPKMQKQIEMLLTYKEMLPDELYYLILSIDGEINNSYFKMIQQGMGTMIDQSFSNIDGLKNFLVEICDITLSCEKFYMG